MRSSTPLLTAAWVVISGLTAPAADLRPRLREDGKYQFNDGNSSVPVRVAFDRLLVRATATLDSQVVTIPAKNSLSEVIAHAKSLEASSQRQVELVGTVGQDEITIRRKVTALVPQTTDLPALAAKIKAIAMSRPIYNPNYVQITFANGGDALQGTEALLLEPGVTMAVPQRGQPRAVQTYFVPNDPYFIYQSHLSSGIPANFPLRVNDVTWDSFVPATDPLFPLPPPAGFVPPTDDINVINPLLSTLPSPPKTKKGVWDIYKGLNIKVGVVDDGLETSHEDFVGNVLAAGGWNFERDIFNPTDGMHGTCVGGLIAARGNNAKGVAGVALQGKLIGLNIVGPSVTLDDLATALLWNRSLHISNNSWGHRRAWTPVYQTVLDAIFDGTTKGRGGRGSIYCFAAGNSGHRGRDANYDYLTNSPYTISVASPLPVNNPGACNVISAPANGATTDRTGDQGMNIDGTDVWGGQDLPRTNYTASYGNLAEGDNNTVNTPPVRYPGLPLGLERSPGAPRRLSSGTTAVASGAIALLMQAKPTLGWRDVQDVLIRTARAYGDFPVVVPPPPPPLPYAEDLKWVGPIGGATDTVGRGYPWFYWQNFISEDGTIYHFSPDQGAGQLDIGRAIDSVLPVTFKNLKPPYKREVEDQEELLITEGVRFVAKPLRLANIPRVRTEHTLITLQVDHPDARELDVWLVSPGGTVSVLQQRGPSPAVLSEGGSEFYTRPTIWTYSSVLNWGQCAGGDWKLLVRDAAVNGSNGRIVYVKAEFWGGPGRSPSAPPVITDEGLVPYPTPLDPLHIPTGIELCQYYDLYTIGASTCPTSYRASGLPKGLVCDPLTGRIYGKIVECGTFSVTLFARNEKGETSRVVPMVVRPDVPVPIIQAYRVGIGAVNQPFRMKINNRALPPTPPGCEPLPEATWAATGLPPGLTLDAATGEITGIPTTEGLFYVTVQASNYCGNDITRLWDPVINAWVPTTYIRIWREGRSIAGALDVPGQLFTTDYPAAPPTNGEDVWYYTTEDSVSGGDALYSPRLGGSQVASIATTVTGPATVQFDWRTSGVLGLDFVRFFMEPGGELNNISGIVPWTHESFDIPPGTFTLRWVYENGSSQWAADDHSVIDNLTITVPALSTATDAPAMSFNVYGAGQWSEEPTLGATGGTAAASPAGLADSASASFETTVTGPGTLNFRWAVSSAQDSDFLRFLIDGAVKQSISGAPVAPDPDPNFVNVSVPIPAGSHVVRWMYEKDAAPVPAGQDRGWVDQISFTSPAPSMVRTGTSNEVTAPSDPAPLPRRLPSRGFEKRSGIRKSASVPVPTSQRPSMPKSMVTEALEVGQTSGNSAKRQLRVVDGEIVFTYSVDRTQRDLIVTPQGSRDNRTWENLTPAMVSEEGTVRLMKVTEPDGAGSHRHFRLLMDRIPR